MTSSDTPGFCDKITLYPDISSLEEFHNKNWMKRYMSKRGKFDSKYLFDAQLQARLEMLFFLIVKDDKVDSTTLRRGLYRCGLPKTTLQHLFTLSDGTWRTDKLSLDEFCLIFTKSNRTAISGGSKSSLQDELQEETIFEALMLFSCEQLRQNKIDCILKSETSTVKQWEKLFALGYYLPKIDFASLAHGSLQPRKEETHGILQQKQKLRETPVDLETPVGGVRTLDINTQANHSILSRSNKSTIHMSREYLEENDESYNPQVHRPWLSGLTPTDWNPQTGLLNGRSFLRLPTIGCKVRLPLLKYTLPGTVIGSGERCSRINNSYSTLRKIIQGRLRKSPNTVYKSSKYVESKFNATLPNKIIPRGCIQKQRNHKLCKRYKNGIKLRRRQVEARRK